MILNFFYGIFHREMTKNPISTIKNSRGTRINCERPAT